MSTEENGTLSPEKYAIGISFGNSYSSIAHISGEGKVEVIANEEGDRQIPSILSYVEGEEYHGTQAKAQLIRNSKNTIAFFRDYIGKSYDQIDPTPSKYSARPQDDNGQVVYQVRSDPEKEEAQKVSISQVTTRHFQKIKNSATDYTGKNITSAVVSVPTDTTNEQKDALTKAAQDADLEILQFIHEPAAAVLAYDSRATDVADRTILVADFGGTRSDATVIVCSGGGLYSIVATTHDYELGGTLLDQVLIDHIAKEFEKKHKSDPRKTERSLAKLKLECENVKKALSQSATATFSVESLADGQDFRATINRTRYQLLAVKQFQRFTRLVEEVLKKANLDVLDVDQVILSGGTSHTPKIAENIQALFDSKTAVYSPSTSTAALSPSELSARGAALQASMIQDIDKEDINQSLHEMVTITPHTNKAIGVSFQGRDETFTVVVPATTAVPARRSKTITLPSTGDATLLISEADSSVKVTQPEIKPKTNGATVEDEEDSDEDSDEEEEEEEEVRERIWKVGQTLGELHFSDAKKGTKIEIVINVDAKLGLQINAREAGGKGGASGKVEAPKVSENGHA